SLDKDGTAVDPPEETKPTAPREGTDSRSPLPGGTLAAESREDPPRQGGPTQTRDIIWGVMFLALLWSDRPSAFHGPNDGLRERGQVVRLAGGNDIPIDHRLLVDVGRTRVDDIVLDGEERGRPLPLESARGAEEPGAVADGGDDAA